MATLDYQWINSNQALAAACQQARLQAAVALDTEFIRIRSYYPQLGLLQLFDGLTVNLVDPLAISDWQPFIALLTDTNVDKYLHACGEDIELFQYYFNCVPTPMLDSQVITAFIGHPPSLGFASLVAEYSGEIIDKTETRADWLARPLTENQCQYAAADVYYLLPIVKQLLTLSTVQQRLPMIQAECQTLVARRQHSLSPCFAYLAVGQYHKLTTRQLALLQSLAAWRLWMAQTRDLALNFVVKTEQLWQLARHQPTRLQQLNELGLHNNEIRHYGEALLKLVAMNQQLDERLLPNVAQSLLDKPYYKRYFKQIKQLIHQLAEQLQISEELLASRRQINQLLNWHWQLTPAALPEICNQAIECDPRLSPTLRLTQAALPEVALPELYSSWRANCCYPLLASLLASEGQPDQ